MALIDMVMPRMGESIMECTVIHWLKQVGDRVDLDDSLLEVATDKVDTEVPAGYAGTLSELLVHDGDVVAIGAAIARIEVDVTTDSAAGQPAVSPVPAAPPVEPVLTDLPAEVAASAFELEASIGSMSSKPALAPTDTSTPADAPSYGNRFYSPLVLSIAKQEGIPPTELERIPGTGAEQRITKKDMLAYIEQRKNLSSAPSTAPVTAPFPGPAPVANADLPATNELRKTSVNGAATPGVTTPGQHDIIQMDRMRKLIAERMVASKQISPHVSSFVEADMTTIVKWRTKTKDSFRQQTGENLTYTPILIEAVVKAIKDFPLINVSVEGDTIIVKRQINIGMAVALPTGNLIVPVIHEADQYNLVGLTKRVNDLTQRARTNKLTADDLANGTYTISNIGTFGNIMGTPIILQPQVAIMAFGAIQKKPAVIETPQGDLLGIRQLMFLSHSYDHRVVDGSLGGQFVRRVADYLEQFDVNQKL